MKPVYHPGEIAVQKRAGVRAMAERIGQSIAHVIPPRARDFLHAQPWAVVGTVDAGGRIWASLLTGRPGFMSVVDERLLSIDARPIPCDPLGDTLKGATDAGLLIIDVLTRRRMRLNGTMAIDPEGLLRIHAEQVYSNCPKYIQSRKWRIGPSEIPRVVERGRALTGEQKRWIARSDTFFIASYHPRRFADASHRGGNPGFVRVRDDRRLAWRDYAGNNMFQTLGNIWSYPRVGLLFVDFEAGDTLQLTGRAKIVWDGEQRFVELEIDEALHIAHATNLRWDFLDYSPFNPS